MHLQVENWKTRAQKAVAILMQRQGQRQQDE
jgi:hypothetical protein